MDAVRCSCISLPLDLLASIDRVNRNWTSVIKFSYCIWFVSALTCGTRLLVFSRNTYYQTARLSKGTRTLTPFGVGSQRSVWRYSGEIHGRESSYREVNTILGSIVDPGFAISASAQSSRDEQCGGKTGGG
jgi:hypothetical protein